MFSKLFNKGLQTPVIPSLEVAGKKGAQFGLIEGLLL